MKTMLLPISNECAHGGVYHRINQDSSARSLMTIPSILEDLCLMPDEEALHFLALLDFVAVGGGPIKICVGERLVAMRVRLLNHYGATEIGAITPIFCPQSDYDRHYLRFRKEWALNLLQYQVRTVKKDCKSLSDVHLAGIRPLRSPIVLFFTSIGQNLTFGCKEGPKTLLRSQLERK